MNSQSREDAAGQLRAWATSRSLPSDQIEQMAEAGYQWHDQHQRQHQQQHQQQHKHPFVHHMQPQPINIHPPSNGFFPIPAMPAMPMFPPLVPNLPYPPPPFGVPAMFPTIASQNMATPVNQSSTTTNFPGGHSTQQTSSYAGQQGTTTFQYSSNSTSMRLEPGAQFQTTMQPGFPVVTHSAQLMAPVPSLQQPSLLQYQQQPTTQSLPPRPQELPLRPRDHISVQNSVTPVATTAPVPPETLFNPAMDDVVDQEPQNPRLAETFRQQLEADEATYFSPVPGRADWRVDR
ncbi:hypothetical protein Q7P36_006948 [Cladosporium allicinum]